MVDNNTLSYDYLNMCALTWVYVYSYILQDNGLWIIIMDPWQHFLKQLKEMSRCPI